MQTTPPHWQRNIAIFLLGQFLSGITSMTVQYAIIWYLTAKTGSATILSIATLLGMLPTILLSPFVGPYICLLYTSPSPRDATLSRMPSSA